MRISFVVACVAICLTALAFAQEPKQKVFTDAAKADADFAVQGEYEGRIGKEAPIGVQLVAQEGDGRFEGAFYSKGLPGGGFDRSKVAIKGQTKDGVVALTGNGFTGKIENGKLTGTLDDAAVELKRVERQSPTLGAKPPAGAIVLFDGSSVDQWAGGRLEGNLLAVGTRTKRTFRDYTLHLEFRTPYQPYDRGQGRGNSGLYLGDQYEFQILDSFGLTGENNECGGYYKFAKPAVNMCLPPLSWQTYDVDFSMARFGEGGKKTKPAIATVRLNGVVIHDKYEIPSANGGGGLDDESKPGAIFLQNHNNPVNFRNIWMVEKN